MCGLRGRLSDFPLEGRSGVTALSPPQFDGLPLEEEVLEGDGSLEKELAIDNIIGEKIEIIAPVTSPSLDFNDNEDIPTELSDSSDTHDEGGHLTVGAGGPSSLPVEGLTNGCPCAEAGVSLGSWWKGGWVTALFKKGALGEFPLWLSVTD